MRLDLFLKTSRLIVRRSLAQEFCDSGMIKVNDKTAKSSKEVHQNDEIEINRAHRQTKIKVLEIPAKKQVSKSEAAELYQVISENIVEDEILDY